MNAEVKGSTLPILEMILDPGEFIISTHGELSWMTPNMQLTQTTGAPGQQGGGGGGFMNAIKRMAGGGGLFLTRYEPVNGQGMVVFAAKVPGRIFPVEIGPSGYCVHRHGWVCGTPNVVPTMAFQQSLTGGIWGGDGFLLQKLEGQGTAWIELSGEITMYELAPGQTLLVHPGHVGMFQDTVNFSVQRIQGMANRFLGGDGGHLAVLTGPGSIWLQSMPLPVLAHGLQPYLEKQEEKTSVAAGGAAGMLGGMLGRGL